MAFCIKIPLGIKTLRNQGYVCFKKRQKCFINFALYDSSIFFNKCSLAVGIPINELVFGNGKCIKERNFCFLIKPVFTPKNKITARFYWHLHSLHHFFLGKLTRNNLRLAKLFYNLLNVLIRKIGCLHLLPRSFCISGYKRSHT